MKISTPKTCPKCHKTFVSTNNVCPYCNPKTALAMGAMELLTSILAGKK